MTGPCAARLAARFIPAVSYLRYHMKYYRVLMLLPTLLTTSIRSNNRFMQEYPIGGGVWEFDHCRGNNDSSSGPNSIVRLFCNIAKIARLWSAVSRELLLASCACHRQAGTGDTAV